jgi:uncharacterized protein YdcH (DUF465 family)
MADAQLPDKTSDVNDRRLRTDDTLHQLVTEHHELDERIRHLSSFAHLTDQQQFEENLLKKQKLALKDRIEAMKRGPKPPTQH